MTAHKVIVLECDNCGATALPPGLTINDLINMVRPAPSGVVDARHRATTKGWTHTASGKDLCSGCGPTRPTKGKLLDHITHPFSRHH